MEVHHHHQAKPWHGWREFAKELGTIVLGVLIALGAGQSVEWLHNRNEIREAREALHAELVKTAVLVRDSLLEDQCLLARVNLAIRYEGPPVKPELVLTLNEGPPVDTVWETVRSGAITRMPLEERLAYTNFYAQLINQRTAAQATGTLMTSLAGFVFGNWPPTPAEWRLARQDLVRSQVLLSGKVQLDRTLLTELKSLGVRPPPLSRAAREGLEAECRVAGAPLGASE